MEKAHEDFETTAAILERAYALREYYKVNPLPEPDSITEESVRNALLEKGYDPFVTIEKTPRLTELLRRIIRPDY